MKKLISIVSMLVVAMLLASCGGGAETKKEEKKAFNSAVGYKIEGDNIVFVFNPADYPAGFDETEMVTVAGEFNGWDAGAKDWQAVKKDDGMWYFSVPKAKVPAGTKFKFVVNTVDWQQPDTTKVPKESLVDDGFGGFNLVCIY